MAAEQLVEQLGGSVEPGQIDLAMLFVSGRHINEMAGIGEYIADALGPRTLIGVGAEGIIGPGREVERRAAASLFVASMPGTSVSPFLYKNLPHVKDSGSSEELLEFAEAMGVGSEHRATMLLADPCSVPINPVIDAMNAIGRHVPNLESINLMGGMASASPAPGGNVLMLDDKVMRSGGVGVSIAGDVRIDSLVSQGCRPIGPPLVVTEARNNVIISLGGRSPVEVVHEIISDLSPDERELLPNGVFLGRVINEYKGRFGPGDFLIRGVIGIDQRSGAIAVADHVRTGQTVQFHLRDAQAATDDLDLLLNIEQVRGPAAGAILFSCNGRGSRFFDEANHDASRMAGSLRTPEGDAAPVAGFFAAGELGPLNGVAYLHSHTASAAIIRPNTSI